MLDDLQELRTFARVISAGSLSAAARDLGVTLGVVSKRLAALERRAGVRLVNRTTRRLSPTEEGDDLYRRALRILADVADAEAMLRQGLDAPVGLLRIGAPVSFGRVHVAPVCADLAGAHPALSIELVLTDRLANLVEERIDVAVRIGEPQASTAIMRKLADNHRVVVAAPAYVRARGAPSGPDDLGAHGCLSYGDLPSPWRLVGPGGERRDVRGPSRLHTNSGDVAYEWALAGRGLILKSWVDVAGDVREGRLVHLMRDWRTDPAPVCALFPANPSPPLRVRRFLEAMRDRLRGASNRA